MKYLLLTLRHKWFVLLAGIKVGAPIWRLLIHDWTKLLPSELYQYQRQFFGDQGDPNGFAVAWLKHQNTHPHHWEYWIPRTGHNRCTRPVPDNEPLPMPDWAVREMLADWMGACRSYEGNWPMENDTWSWLDRNLEHVRLHPDTCVSLDALLTVYKLGAKGK